MATTEWAHTTVMLKESVEALDVQDEATYVDTTFGRGGHAKRILDLLGPQGRLIAFDKDPQAVATAQAINDPRLTIRHQGFAALNQLPSHSAAGVLMDLGVSSPQIDNPERGFSFRQDGPLDMRMDTSQGQSVHAWLVEAKTEQIAQVIRDYGEERFANGIAKAIVARRDHGMSRFDALLDACHKRARPIIMTTIAMGAGMLPIAIGWGAADPSFRSPMSIAVIGGLITSTVLSLLVIPVVFTYIDDLGLWVQRRLGRGGARSASVSE
jgi:16S rRNA (cytosine(1402)-N(4))-methyltransferase